MIVRFNYTRLSHVAQQGFVEIDLDNPADPVEIRKKLSGYEFTRQLSTDEVWDDQGWEFAPAYPEDVPAPELVDG